MPPKGKRVPSAAGRRLDPLEGSRQRTASKKAPSRHPPDSGSSRAYSTHRSEAPLPPKPNSAGVSTRKASAHSGRSGSTKPIPSSAHQSDRGMNNSGSQLFTQVDKITHSSGASRSTAGPTKPPKVRRPERDRVSDVDYRQGSRAKAEGHAAVRSGSPSPSAASFMREGPSVAVPAPDVTRSEAHSRSKALCDGSPSSSRGILNLTPTKRGENGDRKQFSMPNSVSPSRADAHPPTLSKPSASSSQALSKREKPVLAEPVKEPSRSSAKEGVTSSVEPRPSRSRSKRREEEPLQEAVAMAHADPSTWNKHIPSAAAKVLMGRALEAPFTTHLWKQAYRHPEEEEDDRDKFDDKCRGSCNPHIHQYDRKNRDGYYACIRCKAPICSPKYQVVNDERGIAAFQHINAEALRVEIDLAGDAIRGKHTLQMNPDGECSIHFVAFCAHCRGCLGVCTMEIPSSMSDAVESGELFYANSSCLVYLRCRTSANLKGVIVGNETETRDGMLDDDDINELLSNDNFGLDINDFESEDGEAARRPLITFPSDSDDDWTGEK